MPAFTLSHTSNKALVTIRSSNGTSSTYNLLPLRPKSFTPDPSLGWEAGRVRGVASGGGLVTVALSPGDVVVSVDRADSAFAPVLIVSSLILFLGLLLGLLWACRSRSLLKPRSSAALALARKDFENFAVVYTGPPEEATTQFVLSRKDWVSHYPDLIGASPEVQRRVFYAAVKTCKGLLTPDDVLFESHQVPDLEEACNVLLRLLSHYSDSYVFSSEQTLVKVPELPALLSPRGSGKGKTGGGGGRQKGRSGSGAAAGPKRLGEAAFLDDAASSGSNASSNASSLRSDGSRRSRQSQSQAGSEKSVPAEEEYSSDHFDDYSVSEDELLHGMREGDGDDAVRQRAELLMDLSSSSEMLEATPPVLEPLSTVPLVDDDRDDDNGSKTADDAGSASARSSVGGRGARSRGPALRKLAKITDRTEVLSPRTVNHGHRLHDDKDEQEALARVGVEFGAYPLFGAQFDTVHSLPKGCHMALLTTELTILRNLIDLEPHPQDGAGRAFRREQMKQIALSVVQQVRAGLVTLRNQALVIAEIGRKMTVASTLENASGKALLQRERIVKQTHRILHHHELARALRRQVLKGLFFLLESPRASAYYLSMLRQELRHQGDEALVRGMAKERLNQLRTSLERALPKPLSLRHEERLRDGKPAQPAAALIHDPEMSTFLTVVAARVGRRPAAELALSPRPTAAAAAAAAAASSLRDVFAVDRDVEASMHVLTELYGTFLVGMGAQMPHSPDSFHRQVSIRVVAAIKRSHRTRPSIFDGTLMASEPPAAAAAPAPGGAAGVGSLPAMLATVCGEVDDFCREVEHGLGELRAALAGSDKGRASVVEALRLLAGWLPSVQATVNAYVYISKNVKRLGEAQKKLTRAGVKPTPGQVAALAAGAIVLSTLERTIQRSDFDSVVVPLVRDGFPPLARPADITADIARSLSRVPGFAELATEATQAPTFHSLFHDCWAAAVAHASVPAAPARAKGKRARSSSRGSVVASASEASGSPQRPRADTKETDDGSGDGGDEVARQLVAEVKTEQRAGGALDRAGGPRSGLARALLYLGLLFLAVLRVAVVGVVLLFDIALVRQALEGLPGINLASEDSIIALMDSSALSFASGLLSSFFWLCRTARPAWHIKKWGCGGATMLAAPAMLTLAVAVAASSRAVLMRAYFGTRRLLPSPSDHSSVSAAGIAAAAGAEVAAVVAAASLRLALVALGAEALQVVLWAHRRGEWCSAADRTLIGFSMPLSLAIAAAIVLVPAVVAVSGRSTTAWSQSEETDALGAKLRHRSMLESRTWSPVDLDALYVIGRESVFHPENPNRTALHRLASALMWAAWAYWSAAKRLVLISVGVWTDDAVLAFDVVPLAFATSTRGRARLEGSSTEDLLERLRDTPRGGWNDHASVLSLMARSVAGFWLLVPYGAILYRVAESLSCNPCAVVAASSVTAYSHDLQFISVSEDGGVPMSEDYIDHDAMVAEARNKVFKLEEARLRMTAATEAELEELGGAAGEPAGFLPPDGGGQGGDQNGGGSVGFDALEFSMEHELVEAAEAATGRRAHDPRLLDAVFLVEHMGPLDLQRSLAFRAAATLCGLLQTVSLVVVLWGDKVLGRQPFSAVVLALALELARNVLFMIGRASRDIRAARPNPFTRERIATAQRKQSSLTRAIIRAREHKGKAPEGQWSYPANALKID